MVGGEGAGVKREREKKDESHKERESGKLMMETECKKGGEKRGRRQRRDETAVKTRADDGRRDVWNTSIRCVRRDRGRKGRERGAERSEKEEEEKQREKQSRRVKNKTISKV